MRDRIAGNHHGNENRRCQIGEDQDAILRHLRVSDAFHAAEHGIKENDAHADEYAGGYRNV